MCEKERSLQNWLKNREWLDSFGRHASGRDAVGQDRGGMGFVEGQESEVQLTAFFIDVGVPTKERHSGGEKLYCAIRGTLCSS